ncbi:MAG: D-2-hydroxyacid dehydrogenase [Gemmatimonadaceae bacterium]
MIGARAHAELAAGIRAHRPELEIRGAPHVSLTADDLQWGDCYLGFKRPPTGTWGGIRWIHCTGAGVDAFIYGEPLPDSILLTRTSEPFGPAISEFAVSRALAFTQDFRAVERNQRTREWKSVDTRMLSGSRVLVVGTGEVGTAIANRFTAMGCHVRGVSRSGGSRPGFERVFETTALAEVVPDADFLVLATPLTPETRGLVSRSVLACCRGAVLINVGRGAVVDESAIPEALDAGWLRGAALDVFDVEPLPVSSPLWDRADVMVSPHGSGPTTLPAAIESFLETLGTLERGERPIGLVDRERGY